MLFLVSLSRTLQGRGYITMPRLGLASWQVVPLAPAEVARGWSERRFRMPRQRNVDTYQVISCRTRRATPVSRASRFRRTCGRSTTSRRWVRPTAWSKAPSSAAMPPGCTRSQSRRAERTDGRQARRHQARVRGDGRHAEQRPLRAHPPASRLEGWGQVLNYDIW